MNLTIAHDPPRQLVPNRCDCCGTETLVVTGHVNADNKPCALYLAACNPHAPEAFIDVVLGSWGDNAPDDHVTFGCRVGPLEGSSGPVCSLVPAAAFAPNSPLFGAKLDREGALQHPRLGMFWNVVDLVLMTDPTVHPHVYGHKPRKKWFGLF